MDNKKQILNEFQLSKNLYDGFMKKTIVLLEELLSLNNIKSHQITCRIKNPEKLKEKIERKNDKYSELKEITDIVGIRVITYYEDEVDAIAKLIEKEFEIDPLNSIDKRVLETDKFGYRSLHYIIKLSKTRIELPEYKSFENLKVEIQIRSILQHAWAEIEHDLGYKGEFEIPDFAKRRFYRIAALLETADIEFVQLKKILKEYEKQLPKQIKHNPENVIIDRASLIKFIETSKVVKRIDKKLADLFDTNVSENLPEDDLYLNRLNYFKIKTIKELENLLIKYENSIVEFTKEFVLLKDFHTPRGWSIFYLTYVLAIKNNDINEVLKFIEQTSMKRMNSKIFASQILKAGEKITIPNN